MTTTLYLRLTWTISPEYSANLRASPAVSQWHLAWHLWAWCSPLAVVCSTKTHLSTWSHSGHRKKSCMCGLSPPLLDRGVSHWDAASPPPPCSSSLMSSGRSRKNSTPSLNSSSAHVCQRLRLTSSCRGYQQSKFTYLRARSQCCCVAQALACCRIRQND